MISSVSYLHLKKPKTFLNSVYDHTGQKGCMISFTGTQTTDPRTG